MGGSFLPPDQKGMSPRSFGGQEPGFGPTGGANVRVHGVPAHRAGERG
jgi:hypothetical protein